LIKAICNSELIVKCINFVLVSLPLLPLREGWDEGFMRTTVFEGKKSLIDFSLTPTLSRWERGLKQQSLLEMRLD